MSNALLAATALEPFRRWTAARKAMVVRALNAGAVTRSDVRRAHGVTDGEIAQWLAAYGRRGAEGLRIRPRKAAP